jgi:aryl-alcohol dehydrogenase-like predicted oxidoreductase
VSRSWVEGQAMKEALARCGASVVASYVLAGGILTGKYLEAGARGRMAEQLDAPQWEEAVAVADELHARSAEEGTTPAALAIAFALSNPDVATVLFGATTPEQVRENVRAIELVS